MRVARGTEERMHFHAGKLVGPTDQVGKSGIIVGRD